MKIRVCVDRGGTFTDCIAFVPNSIQPPGTPQSTGFRTLVVKLLSVDPQNYQDAPREGIRRILELATGKKHPRDQPLDISNLEIIRMGTTVATNALLERKGARTVLLTTKGFKDLLHIGNQSRPDIFDISISKPDVLYEQVLEVDERVTLVGFTAVTDRPLVIPKDDPSYVKGVSGEWVRIIKKPDLTKIEHKLRNLLSMGITSVAICFIHSFTFPEHEILVEQLCRKLGFEHVARSSDTSPMVKMVPRGTSATADGYLTPVIKQYLKSFFSGFDKKIQEKVDGKYPVKIEFMQSDGGLVHVDNFDGYRAILSGPAGGVVGYAMTSWEKNGKPVIGFDMGGTSTDVSRFGGQYEHVFESITAGIPIQAPQLDINTVAAGGGSVLSFRNGMFTVGPESASANPGPACYRKGGPLAITDANLLLGRLVPDYFPKIFGKTEKEPLDKQQTIKQFTELQRKITQFLKERQHEDQSVKQTEMSLDEIAYGFVQVANESMCRPIRALTQGKGYNSKDHILACFGGAGGQHAFAIARTLGIKQILIHKYSSILSAYGLGLADVVKEAQTPCAQEYDPKNMKSLKEKAQILQEQCVAALKEQGFPDDHISTQIFLNLRYQGTDTQLMTLKPSDDWNFEKVFESQYQQEFGFTLPDRKIFVDDIRIRGTGHSIATGSQVTWTQVHQELKKIKIIAADKPERSESVYWKATGRTATPVYLLEKLKQGTKIVGPALIIDATATIAVEPDTHCIITSEHVVGILDESTQKSIDTAMDPIMLSVFGHRFMSIAEQMGRTLQKTSISTNIKERLDFSCALFGPDGGLVANAPHIPVHLGSMQEAVKWQMNHCKSIKEGDVLLTNHPAAGGSHLPDITVITPVFDHGKIAFFVASRGHHADIGGMQPGSMPPNSRELYQEGAAIKSFKLVQNGAFDESGITKLLLEEPSKFEGCSGTRCLKDNISDLKAQVAANHRGITLIKSLIEEYTLPVVQAYMGYIRENAELAVRDLLQQAAKKHGNVLESVDFMDDGSPIQLKISIEPNGSAVFDFEGTGPEVYGNTNAPTSVTYSAIIYCLRCLIKLDMPLNQGALAPITVKIPQSSLLNPSETAAVVGGNVLTSQRLCDVIFKAFKACAASQGCCNNFTFGMGNKDKDGNERQGFGYYETIAGGAGAGPNWHGRSGVHTHMTNTRITDPEILERRYPVLLHQFGLRAHSGGEGEFTGGDGVIREIEFLETLDVSILSERRVYAPYGLEGGAPGKPGQNLLLRKTQDGYRTLNFGGKNATVVHAGDRIRIETPGAGGFGSKSNKRKQTQIQVNVKKAGGSLQNYHDTQYQ
ncbi:Hydantoinase B/oxoprolinase-domain-containing protein [Gorgonomyces haynaldii]|nr:Hydantoinase B/oxoprolinase-domain-containing protein [Gorgonomyces haynaldii]